MKNKYISKVDVPTIKKPNLGHLSNDQLETLLKATDIELTLRKTLRIGRAWVSQAVYKCYIQFLNPNFRLRKSKNNKLYSINKKNLTRAEMSHTGSPFQSFCIRYANKKKLKPMTYAERIKYFK